jgi:hypothetical protein
VLRPTARVMSSPAPGGMTAPSPAGEVAPLLHKQDPLPGQTEAANASKPEHAAYLKAMSLIMVTVQTTTMVVLARFTRVGDRVPYSICSMVIMSEMLKVFLSWGLLSKQVGGLAKATGIIHRAVCETPDECLKLLVPAGLYFFQNNVLIFAGDTLHFLPAEIVRVSH